MASHHQIGDTMYVYNIANVNADSSEWVNLAGQFAQVIYGKPSLTLCLKQAQAIRLPFLIHSGIKCIVITAGGFASGNALCKESGRVDKFRNMLNHFRCEVSAISLSFKRFESLEDEIRAKLIKQIPKHKLKKINGKRKGK